ncbi:MAG: T9SS type A sorting domain-containing protein [Fibrobacter sp.]|uniref:T9SS type A sorting domain-containing protein n=1 Tax=Fibrobacter sp. TaxID=35828 RepID=UPI0025BD3E13|nr:T9SS type A sorting domain-containing protein [Fibrobacter sp.]MBR4786105.1 T9SS type A sorting domain-containing protein [Fibrobacter sp.]
MNKRRALGVFACAATAAFAAGNVSNVLYWNGATDTESRVETGSPNPHAGYWYEYNDSNDGGTSKFTFPSDVEENAYGNFFGPLVEAYGGVKAHVELGEGYDYPYAGLGFNIWNEEQDGADISSWGGIVIGYESTLSFSAELQVENDKLVTEYDNFKARLPKAPSGTEYRLDWSKFKQGGWGKTARLNYVLGHTAAVRLVFEGSPGTSGDFRITSIRSIRGNVDTVITPRPDTTVIVPDTTVTPPDTGSHVATRSSDTLYWDGTVDTEGRVYTGSEDLTAGYWYGFGDANEFGSSYWSRNDSSKITYPSDVEENVYGNFFGPLIEAYGGIKGSVMLGDGYDYPYVGVGFNIWSENQEGVDISSWGGIALKYESTLGFSVELAVEDEKNYVQYDNYMASIRKSPTASEIVLPWSKFKQGGWGTEVNRDSVLARVAGVRIRFEGTAGTSGDFRIIGIRSLGKGAVVPPAPDTTVHPDPHVTARVSNTLYWDGAVDTEGRVATGSGELTAGYWYDFSDSEENNTVYCYTPDGTSKITYPSDVHENVYGNFFGPLVEAYGGVKGHVALGEGCDYPHAGVGFNIWSENQEGVNVSSWGGLVVKYESTLGFNLELAVEDEKEYVDYDNYMAYLPKSPAVSEIVLPWSKFKQGGWGTLVDRDSALARIAAVRFRFEGTAGTSGDFRIISVRAIGGGTVVPPAPDTTIHVSSLTSYELYWDGTVDTEGRVETGSEERTSGYWYEYDDANDGGSSKMIWPSDVEENAYGNFFGPLVETYNGVKGSVVLGEGYDYPYAGVGFNIWSENQEGVDISSWEGIVIKYESTIGFQVELGVENPRDMTEYDEFKAYLPKSPTVSEIVLPWSKFKQGGWGKIADINSVLGNTATIRFKFEGTAGTSGSFRIISVRSIKNGPSTIIPPTPVKEFVSKGLYWDGAKDELGRVNTGSNTVTYGYWYEETDENEHGHSKFVWPANVHENVYGNFFGPLVETYHGIKGRVKLNRGARNPYASLGFNVWSENQEGTDVSAWGGIVIEYESTVDFSVELVTDGNKKDSYYGTYAASAPKSSRHHTRQLVLPWSKFKRSTGWNRSVDKTSALKHIAAIKIKFEGRAGTVGDFRITKIRSINNSSAVAFNKPEQHDIASVKTVASPKANADITLSDRTLSLQGITAGKVEVRDLKGHVVKSVDAGSAVDLSSLKAGVYMVRVVGPGIGLAKKIVLK